MAKEDKEIAEMKAAAKILERRERYLNGDHREYKAVHSNKNKPHKLTKVKKRSHKGLDHNDKAHNEKKA